VSALPQPPTVEPVEFEPVEFEPLPVRSADWNRVRPVEWLWDSRVAIGKLNLLVGEEGGGKGTLLAWLTVRTIRGELPGDREGQPQRVLIVGDEDGYEDTWLPRMVAAGATREQIDRMVLLLEHDLDFVRDEKRLLATVEREGIGFVIVDQVLDHIDGGKDGSATYNPKHIRQVLLPFRKVAKVCDVATLAACHPIKGTPKTFRDLIGGSHQMNAVSRSSLWLGQDPDSDDARARVVTRGKGNLSAEPPSFEFEIHSHEFELNGHDFNMPVVTNPREGFRYRVDFEGGAGFGKESKRSLPAHEEIKEEVYDLLTATPQSVRAISDEIPGRAKETVKRAIRALETEGRAVLKDRGWIRNPHYTPPEPEPEPHDEGTPSI
jgi:DNA-binding winged helix-turn-helix (wHTH) protein